MKTTLYRKLLLGLAVLCACSFCVACTCNDTKTDGNSNETKYYTVTFDLCTDLKTTTALPKQVQAGKRLDSPQVYVIGDNPDNYSISDWYTDKNFSEDSKWDFYFDSVEGDITLYAKWDAHIKYKVNFFNGSASEATYTATIDKGLTTNKCDDQFTGYEVLGYYTDTTYNTEFDFDTPINANTNIYVKLSDYIYFTPQYLSTFSAVGGVTTTLAEDGTIELNYPEGDRYIYKKGLNFAFNGYELIEIVCKLPADISAARVDFYWFGKDSSGNAIAGITDFNPNLQQIGRADFGATVTTDSEGWTHVVYDLTKPRGYTHLGTVSEPLTDIATMTGFRVGFDPTSEATFTIKSIKGVKKPEPTGYAVSYYVNGRVVKTDDVDKGAVATKPEDSEVVTGRQVVGYYTDANFTTAFDFNTPINAKTNLYVKLSDYMYFDGAMLKNFGVHDMSTTLNADGTATITRTGNDSYVWNTGLNLDLNGGNCIEIRAKLNITGTVNLYMFGNYKLNGVAGANTGFGQNYTYYRGLSTQGYTKTNDTDGYVILRYNLAYTTNNEGAKDFIYTTIKGFRIDIGNGDTDGSNYITVDYVKSVEIEQVYNIYYSDGTNTLYTGSATRGTNAEQPADSEVITGRKVLGYYSDSTLTTEFNFGGTEINADTTIYVKLSDYMYFDGTMLNDFAQEAGATKTLNTDGTLTFGGANGAYIYKEGLNLALNGGNCIEIKVKLSATGFTMGLYVYGDYTLDGTATSSTSFGANHNYTMAGDGFTQSEADADGYVTIRKDLAYPNGGSGKLNLVYTTIKGFRLDIWNGTSANTAQIAYVKSVALDPVYTVSYYNGSNVVKTDNVTSGGVVSKPTDISITGKEILGYYTDSSLSAEFDFTTPITVNTNVYIKLSTYYYMDGAMLNNFPSVINVTKTLNADGTLTMSGSHGGYIMSATTLSIPMTNNKIQMRVKTNMANSSRVDIWVQGTYSEKGSSNELTDQTIVQFRGLSTQGWTVSSTDADGYVIMTYDLAYRTNDVPASNYVYSSLKRVRIDLMGGDGTITIDYIRFI